MNLGMVKTACQIGVGAEQALSPNQRGLPGVLDRLEIYCNNPP